MLSMLFGRLSTQRAFRILDATLDVVLHVGPLELRTTVTFVRGQLVAHCPEYATHECNKHFHKTGVRLRADLGRRDTFQELHERVDLRLQEHDPACRLRRSACR